MHAERDHLRDAVFPELEERLRARRHNLEPIDLRLGVETASLADQRARELLVLKVCLNEIERSRPFLLVLIGDRYGWVPPEERIAAAAQEAGYAPDALDKSVTALEIEFGILKKDPEQRRRSLFYFRDPLPYASMSPEDAAVYSDEHSPEPDVRAGHARLQALKDKIASDSELGQRVRHYRLDWDPAEKEPTDASLEAWGRQVLEELWAELDEETREFASRPPADEDEQEREALDEFVQHKLRDFMGRDALVAQLLDLARAPAQEAEAWGACLKGGPGSGKSTVCAALYRELTTAKPDSDDDAPLVLAHAAGITPRASRVDPMLRRFVKELAAATGQASPLEDTASAEEVDRAFAMLLRQVAEHRRVVVLIDALNQFEPTPRAQHLTWLPARYWPDNARLIATSLPGQASESLEQWAGVEELDVPPLGSDEAQDIAWAVWRRYHRECNPDVLAVVLGRTREDGQPACANPLWLTLAMEQLNLLDADDFNRAGQDLHGLLLEMARTLPPDVEGLFAALLARCEELFGASWARAFACLTALGRSGWRESDYKALLPKAAAVLSPGEPPIAWDPLRFAALRRGFRAQIILRGEHGRWDFSHAQMRQAILRQYLADAAVRRALHEAMAGHLLALEAGDPLRDAETMHHLIEADDKKRAAAFFAQEYLSTESVQALAQHIAQYAEQETNPGIAWTISLLRQPDLDPDSLSWLADNILFDLLESIENAAPLPLRLQLLTGVSRELTAHVKRDPANLSWQRNLSVSHNKVGAVLRDQGDLAGAMTAYQACLGIRTRLAEANPSHALWQRDLSVSHEIIGGVLRDQGDLAGAMTAFQAGLGIRTRLVEADPSHAGWQQDLSVSHNNIGDVLIAQGDLTGAMTAY